MKGPKMSGKKTYLFAALTIFWAVLGLFLSNSEDSFVKFDPSTAGALILGSLQVIGLRLGITKIPK